MTFILNKYANDRKAHVFGFIFVNANILFNYSRTKRKERKRTKKKQEELDDNNKQLKTTNKNNTVHTVTICHNTGCES